MSEPKNVLIVCTGNVCRSPMAWGLLQEKLRTRGLDKIITVTTAGTYALDGAPPSAYAQDVLAQRNIDISDHRARTVTQDILRQADVIIVMAEEHRTSLFYRDPSLIHKVVLLSELVGEHRDIEDPYRRPREDYERAAQIIDDYLERGLPTLLQRLGVESS